MNTVPLEAATRQLIDTNLRNLGWEFKKGKNQNVWLEQPKTEEERKKLGGFLFRKDLAKMREYMLSRCELQSIISLPQGVFLPYTGVKTNIIYATKVNKKIKSSEKRKNFWYFDVKSDGYTLDNHRRKLDTPSDLTKYEEYRKLDKEQAEDMLKVGFEIIPLDKVWDNSYVLVGGRYREKGNVNTEYAYKPLREICEIIAGQSPEGTNYNTSSEGLPFYQGNADFGEVYINPPKMWTTQITKEAIKDDLLLSVRAPVGSINICSDKICIGRGLMAIRCKIGVNNKYLFYILRACVNKFKQLSMGSTFESITKRDVEDFLVPMLSLDIQKQIVDELESYQRIIDGARSIIENYKPKLPTLSEYPLIELGRTDLFEIQSGGTPDSKNSEYWNGAINWITLADLPAEDFITQIHHTKRTITQTGLQNSSAKLLPINSVVVSSRATIGRVGIAKIELATNQSFKNIIIKNKDFILPRFLAYSLKEKSDKMLELASGATFKEISKTNFEKLSINVPPLERQREMVEQIETEQALIEPSKRLIEVFTKKINDRIADIWGDK